MAEERARYNALTRLYKINAGSKLISLHAKGCSSLYHLLCLLGIALAGLGTLCIATHCPSFVGCGTTRSIHIAYFVHVRGGEVVGGDVVKHRVQVARVVGGGRWHWNLDGLLSSYCCSCQSAELLA